MQTDKIYVAAHRGMVGSAIVRTLTQQGVLPSQIAAHTHGVQKLLFLGSSCIYPRMAAQPMTELAVT